MDEREREKEEERKKEKEREREKDCAMSFLAGSNFPGALRFREKLIDSGQDDHVKPGCEG